MTGLKLATFIMYNARGLTIKNTRFRTPDVDSMAAPID